MAGRQCSPAVKPSQNGRTNCSGTPKSSLRLTPDGWTQLFSRVGRAALAGGTAKVSDAVTAAATAMARRRSEDVFMRPPRGLVRIVVVPRTRRSAGWFAGSGSDPAEDARTTPTWV